MTPDNNYCSVQPSPVIIKKAATRLRDLPPASDVVFPGAFAWSPLPTSAVTSALGVDPGSWAVWRNRRLTPAPMPATWFRHTTGSPLAYLASDILTWLAARRGERFGTLTSWRHSLRIGFDIDVSDPTEVRKHVALFARAAGPVIGDVRFTPAGFRDYLASLLSLE